MRVLELFSGTASFSKVAGERGHECVTLDNDPKFKPDICIDIMDIDLDPLHDFKAEILHGFKPDIVWASPPCERFSVASMGSAWRGIWHIRKNAYQPMDLRTGTAIALAVKTLQIIKELNPGFWLIENPRANLRKMPFMPNHQRQTAWYCQYGDTRAKPTDIWTNVPIVFRTCHNGNPDHEEARRGAKTGTQGLKGSIERGVVPRQLCEEIIIACEEST